MAKSKADNIAEIRKLLESGKLIIGSERTLKGTKTGRIRKVFIASNCAAGTKGDLQYYCSLGGIELVELSSPNDELGTLCKKPFPISVLGALKE